MTTTLLIAALLASGSCPEPAEKDFWTKLAEITGIAATPEAKGPAGLPEEKGNVVVKLPAARKTLTSGGNFRSPIFSSSTEIIAIKGEEEIVRLQVNGSSDQDGEYLAKVPGAQRIAGLLEADPDLLVILAEEKGQKTAQVLCLSGRKLIAAKDLDQNEPTKLLARLRAGARKYPRAVVETRKDSKGQVDVFENDQNASNCAEMAEENEILACSQGALASDGTLVFIRTSHSKPIK